MDRPASTPFVPVVPLSTIPIISYEEKTPYNRGGALSAFTDNGLVSSLKHAYTSFQERREALGLSNPGTVDGVSREVQRDVLLNNLMFSGLRADLTRVFSATPLFHTAHNFTMGAQGMPPYSFAALFGSPKVNSSWELACNPLLTRHRYSSKVTLTTTSPFPPAPTTDGRLHSSAKPTCPSPRVEISPWCNSKPTTRAPTSQPTQKL